MALNRIFFYFTSVNFCLFRKDRVRTLFVLEFRILFFVRLGRIQCSRYHSTVRLIRIRMWQIYAFHNHKNITLQILKNILYLITGIFIQMCLIFWGSIFYWINIIHPDTCRIYFSVHFFLLRLIVERAM